MKYAIALFLGLTFYHAGAQNALPGEYEPGAQFEKGLELFRLGQFEAAAQVMGRYQEKVQQGTTARKGADYRADAVYYQALCSWHLDRPDTEGRLRDFLKTYPTHVAAPMARIWLARRTFRNKQYRETLQELAPVTIPDAWLPDSVNQEVRYMAGISWYQYKENEKALRYFSDLVQYEGKWKNEALRYTGVIQYELGRFPEAIQTLAPLPPGQQTAESVLALARSYFETGQLDALLALTQDLPENLQDPELYLILAGASLRQEKFSAALNWFDRYQQQRNLNYPALKYQYAYAAFRENRFDLAKPLFEQLVNSPDSLSSLSSYYLAYCFLKEGKTESARLAFMRAASERVPSSITEDAILEYAKISYQEKFLQDAVAQLKNYLRKYPSGRWIQEAKSLIGEVLFYSNNYKESVEYLEAAKTSDARSLSAYQRSCYYYGLELFRKQAYREADVYFRKGFNLTQDMTITDGCRYWYAESQFRQGHFAEALRQYRELTSRPAQRGQYQAESWYGIGWSELMQRKPEEASEAFAKFLSLADRKQSGELFQDALLRSGDCEFYLKHYKEAFQFYQEAMQAGTTYQDYALFQSGRIQYRLEKYTEASAMFRKMIQQHRESDYRDDALDQLAETHLKWLLDYKAASQYSRQLIQEHPQSVFVPAAWNRMGIAAYNSNDKAAAEKFFRKVLTDYCQDTAMAVSALNNMSLIVTSEEFAQVMAQYRKACPEMNPALEGLAWESASDKYEAGAWQDAIPLLSLYLREYPASLRRKDALYFRAVCYDKSGQKDKALPDLEELTGGRLEHERMGAAWKMMAEIYEARKDWKQAAQAYARAREIQVPVTVKWDMGMAETRALQQAGEYGRALEILESLTGLPGLSLTQRYGIGLQKAGLLLAKKDSSLALSEYAALEQEAGETAEGAEAGYYVVLLNAAAGKTEAAEEAALKMKDTHPGYPAWVIKSYMVMIDAYLKDGDEFQAGSLIEYILSQPEEYYPGMKAEAEARQKKLTPQPPPVPETQPETGKKKSK